MSIQPKAVSLEDTAFVIGSGPSLNKVNIGLIKDLIGKHGTDSVNTFGMNRQYVSYKEWGFYPAHWFCIDSRLLRTLLNQDRNDPDSWFYNMIDNPECDTDFYCLLSIQGATDKNVKGSNPVALSKDFEVWNCRLEGSKQGALLIDGKVFDNKIPGTANCGAFATECAFRLGYKRVVLLGIDAFYRGGGESEKQGYDVDHYDSKYFDISKFKQNKTHGSPNNFSGTTYWKSMHKRGLDIVSCSPGSKINDFFPYMPLEEYITNLVHYE